TVERLTNSTDQHKRAAERLMGSHTSPACAWVISGAALKSCCFSGPGEAGPSWVTSSIVIVSPRLVSALATAWRAEIGRAFSRLDRLAESSPEELIMSGKK